MQHLCKTTTGEGSAPVHLLYRATDDGIEIESILAPSGFDLSGYFYDDEILRFKEACQKDYEAICADQLYETAVSRWEARMAA